MIEIFENKVQFIKEISDALIKGVCNEGEYKDLLDKVIAAMSALEIAETMAIEWQSRREKLELDSRRLEILLDIIERSDDKENILAKYESCQSSPFDVILDSDIPF